jgi:uncharacterized protein
VGKGIAVLAWVKRNPLIWFFALSYVVSWPAWVLETKDITWAAFPGYFGPAIAALAIIAITQGKYGLKKILTKIYLWRVPVRWYLIAIFLPIGSVLLAVVFQLLNGGENTIRWVEFTPRLSTLALGFIGLSLYGIFVAAGEEIGWRGYALPGMFKQYNPLVASILVGIFWGFWHLPLRWLYTSDSNLTDALFYGFGIDAAAIIYTWLYLNTRGSILIASLFHAVYDVTVIMAGNLIGNLFSFRVHMIILIIIAALLAVSTQLWRDKYPQEPSDLPN